MVVEVVHAVGVGPGLAALFVELTGHLLFQMLARIQVQIGVVIVVVPLLTVHICSGW